MPELIIREPKDIEKLAGWTMDKVKVQGPAIVMQISHPAASCLVRIVMTPITTMGLSGEVVVAKSGINVAAGDITPEEQSGD